MSNFSPPALEALVRQRAPVIAEEILIAGKKAANESEFVVALEPILEKFSQHFDVTLRHERERTLINGRADAVYNRFVIEYEPPGSLRKEPTYRNNQHAIGQVKQYMEELDRLDRHRKERLAGVVLDGEFFIFVRYRDDLWRVDDPVPVDADSTATFLRYLLSLSTELALTPDNLVRDFGENTVVSRLWVSTLYKKLTETPHLRVHTLFQQWQLQFGEITGWEGQSGNLDLTVIARNFGVKEREPDPLKFFFAVHTYYATFIKILAIQIAHYYISPKDATNLNKVSTFSNPALLEFFQQMEDGGVFAGLGIKNFLEGDFFGWYLDIWDDQIEIIARRLVNDLGNYSLVTLDVDPEETRDLLKFLYQNLMPRNLRHALGEYYTPDWLAERLLNQVGFEGNPDQRILDPACGSGTFPVLIIRRIKSFAKEKGISPPALLQQILKNVVGFDLNPLAVISARTNYLLALGDLLSLRNTEISIPIYLADSILTPSTGEELFSQHAYSFATTVGKFSVPTRLVQDNRIDEFALLLETSVEQKRSTESFQQDLVKTFSLSINSEADQIGIAVALYEQLMTLETKGINGIWSRIIKNSFAPLFQGKFSFVVGNPPWVNWESLPAEYRKATRYLWEAYGLLPKDKKGTRQASSRSKTDISILLTYVAIDKYLKPHGKLGFVVTQTVFKTERGGRGFRRFVLGLIKPSPLKVLHVDDFSSFQPFDQATNRTSVVIIQRDQQNKYPVPYTYWKKRAPGTSIAMTSTLADVIERTITSNWIANPVDPKDLTSPWITGRRGAIQAIQSVAGRSIYYEHVREGSNTRGANGIFWTSILKELGNSKVRVVNLPEFGRLPVPSLQAEIEADLLFPLLRGKDVQQWMADPSLHIIVPHNSNKPSSPMPKDQITAEFPLTYEFLSRFKTELSSRPIFRNFDPSRPEFYPLYNVGHYSFAPYKVVWREQSSVLTSAVAESKHGKPIIPDHKLMMIPFEDRTEAHYVCALLSSAPAQYLVKAYSIQVSISVHVLQYLNIPKLEHSNKLHLDLADFSIQAHEMARRKEDTSEIEDSIDELCTDVWSLEKKEMIELKKTLRE